MGPWEERQAQARGKRGGGGHAVFESRLPALGLPSSGGWGPRIYLVRKGRFKASEQNTCGRWDVILSMC